jgi:hypothetical protein
MQNVPRRKAEVTEKYKSQTNAEEDKPDG